MGNDWFHEYFINELKAIGRKPTSNMQHEVVDSLPSSGNEQTIYFVKNDSSSSNNHYDEYVWISSSSTFEKIGSTQIDGSTAPSDWNQNDDTQPDYIKNRPFYTGDPVETVFVEETTLPFEERGGGLYAGIFETTFLPIVGETYKISWDGSIYESTCVEIYENLCIGNLSMTGEGSDTGEPFLFIRENSKGFVIGTADTASSHTISITGIAIPVVKINPKYLDKPDWDQNDVNASSYIKNRPFYVGYTEEKMLIKESTVNFKESSGHYSGSLGSTFEPIDGETYKVSWDGTVYESVCLNFQEVIIIGNLSIAGAGSDTGEPFFIRIGSTIKIFTLDTSASHTISISGRTTQVVKIDEKYLPDTVATKSDVEAVESTANNAQNTANNAQTTADNAQTTANAAKNTANNAQTTANAAKNTANNAVKYTASQNLTDAQKEQARTNIGAGTSSFSGSWNDLTDKPDKPFKPANKSYLTFSSPNSFTLAVNNATKNWDGTLEYFASDRTWTTWNGTNALSAVYDDGEYVLYLRGTGNTVIASWTTEYWSFTGSNIACIGNIETLLDYAMVESGEHPTMANSCYSSMFSGCTSLTQAPALPATTLANSCYSGMFRGCTSLTQVPALPATTLANNCYSGMFEGCTSLTQAPALPATTLASYCYSSMFSGCTSLTQVPALPATTLASYCYSGMFRGCTSLTQAPALPATTLASYCYSNMFSGCTSLTQAPALPLTTLANYCYSSMFSGCTSLTQVPALPATTLAECCYYFMFEGCTSLKLSSTKTDEYTQEYRIPSSGDGTTASTALAFMFKSTGGTFTRDPSINTTYYLSTDNMIVRETDVVTLNGYVGSMINNAISEHADTAEYIIHSSTEGSTKKFKITVDDTGTISATEVT